MQNKKEGSLQGTVLSLAASSQMRDGHEARHPRPCAAFTSK
jgi:hypothetical protein